MKKKNTGGMLMTVLMYIFLYAPIIIMIVFSFNDSKSRTIWAGFTLRWYQELFRDDLIMSSLQTTIAVSVLASLISGLVQTVIIPSTTMIIISALMIHPIPILCTASSGFSKLLACCTNTATFASWKVP